MRNAAACLAGIVLIVAGLLLLRVDNPTPLRWGWLQDTLRAVFPNPANIVRGAVVILLGGLFYGWSVRNATAFGRGVVDAGPRARKGSRQTEAPLALAIGFYAGTIILVLRGSTGYVAGAFFLAAIVMSSVALARRLPTTSRLFSRWELLWLSVAAVAACVLYLHDAQNWFFSWVGDEYAFFERARSIAEGGPANLFQQDGVYGTHPVMDSVFQSVTIRILGPHALGWRASCAIATAAAVFPIYLIGRMLYSRLVGVLAAGIYLSAHVLLAYAHIGYNEPNALFPLTAAIAMFLAGHLQRAPFYLFLAGIFAGVGWYTISTSRVAIGLILLGVLIYRPGGDWHVALRDIARDLGLILGGFLLVLLPFLLVNGSFTIQAMFNQSRLGQPGSPSLDVLLSQNGVRSLFGFVYLPQVDNHYVAGALFDTLSAFFLLLGVAALLTWRSAHSAFLLIWFGLLVVINGPPYYALHLNTTRMYIVVPAASVIAAVGAGSLIDQICTLLPTASWSRALPAGMAASIVSGVVALNLYTFYHVTPSQMASTSWALAMEVIQSHPEATIVEGGNLGQPPFLLAQEVYGVDQRIVRVSGSVAAAVRAARWRGRPVIVLSDVPVRDPGVRGRQSTVWDTAHMQHITEITVPG